MQQHVEEHVPVFSGSHAEKVLQYRKMSRTGDGQEFGNSLHKAQYDRVPYRHKVTPEIRLCGIMYTYLDILPYSSGKYNIYFFAHPQQML
jgi:hypothetical protein